MADLWTALEERTRAWTALGRQGLADAIWADYVSLRYGRTGDPHALEYLYPYLNHADRGTRLTAIEVAARVFEGRGPRAVDGLGYFTANPAPFLRDRAVQVVGAAVAGSRDGVILETLAPYLAHGSQFVRKQALVALGKAAAGQASEPVLAEILRVADQPGPRPDEVEMAVASAFSAQPNERVWDLVAKPDLASRIDTGNQDAVALLVKGAPEEWYQRACERVFEPRLLADQPVGWTRDFIRRDGVTALSRAAAGRGMEPLTRMLHLRGSRCTGHAILFAAPRCFAGADIEANRGPLLELMETGDVPAQRIASVCLGRLVMGVGDRPSIEALRRLCGAPSRAVQAAALAGLGLAARSTCDDELRNLCLERAESDETAPAAVRALGMIFLGSGRGEVFADLRGLAASYQARPVRGKRYSKPLAACYAATGLLYLGTGSMEPVQSLLDVLARPRTSRMHEYQWVTARALVMIEFPESALGDEYILLG
jgi:hypothetical protein